MSDNGNPFRDNRMYTKADLQEVYCVTERTIDVWSRSGKLPKPVKLQTGGVRWPGRWMVKWYDKQFAEAS